MILVSDCLLGTNCKYSGGNNRNEKVIDYLKDKKYIPVCPEVLGGLEIPRVPAEIVNGDGKDVLDGKAKVLDKNGKDVTDEFLEGAYKTLKIAKKFDCSGAILKARSPSCGNCKIYDGSFSGNLKDGLGVTATLLKKEGVDVKSEEDF